LNKPVAFTDDCIGPTVEAVVNSAHPGDVVLLENVRFHPGEEKNDDQFCAQLAALADVYINDAFGTAHRSHASTVGITKHMEVSAAGFLMKREVETLEGVVENPVRPFVAILGGAKVSGKIEVIKNLAGKVDKVIIGGGMAFTFIKAMGFEIGQSLVEEDMLDLAKQIHEQAIADKIKFYLPVDCVIAASLAPDDETKIVPIQEIPSSWYGMDIGPASVRLFGEVVQNAKTILWNGPMGVFERDAFSRGTFALAHSVANAYAKTIVGGGDTALAVHRAGESESMSFISTGGGAALQLLEGKHMPGLAALPDRPY
jgi:phosphoglycerate kinase